MQWQGKIDFARPITLNGKPHGIDQHDTMPTWDISFDGQIFYVESEKKVYVGTNTEFIELSPNGTTHDHNYLYHTRTEINSKFDVGSGHDHDGTNSKKVLYSSLSGVPSEFNSSVHDNGRHSVSYISAGEVTFNVLDNNSIVGTGATQVAKGNHLHDDRYFTESELGASTGSSLVGVSNILSQTNVQNALQSVVTKFDDYRLIDDSYTKSETNSGFVGVSNSQEILGEKIFNAPVLFKSSITIENDLIPYTEKNLGSLSNNFSKIYVRSIDLDGETFYKNDLYKTSMLYTKEDLQTSGQSEVHWGNLTSVPTFPYAEIIHSHNDLYYTKSEGDNKYSNIVHSHIMSEITDFIDSNYVHSTEDETISGIKTFSQIVSQSISTNNIQIIDNEFPGIFSQTGTNMSILKYDSTLNNFKVEQLEVDGETLNTITSSLIATRNDTMTAGAVPIWNSTTKRFDSSSVTVTGNEINAVDLTLSGNLTVNGTTTSIDTTNLLIEDNIIVLNKNQTGAPATSLSSGIEIERGDAVNYQFMFRELDDLFVIGEVGDLQVVATRDDTLPDGSIAVWSQPNLKFMDSQVTADNGTVYANLSGNASTATKLAASVNINGVAFDGSSNITITAAPTTHSHGDATITDVAWSKVSNKPDPVVTLTGAVTGSGTMTDLGSVSIATTVNHNHDGTYYTETEVSNFLEDAMINVAKAFGRASSSSLAVPTAFINPITGLQITY